VRASLNLLKSWSILDGSDYRIGANAAQPLFGERSRSLPGGRSTVRADRAARWKCSLATSGWAAIWPHRFPADFGPRRFLADHHRPDAILN